MSGRIASPEEMLGLLDTLKQEEEENPSNPLLMLEMMEMLGSNAIMKFHNWGHEFDPSARYGDYYESTGVDPRVAGLLGLLTAVAEPGLGQFRGAAKGVAQAANSLDDVYSVLRGADGMPIRGWRIEAPGGGLGPIAGDMGYEGVARHHGDFEYVRGMAGWRKSGDYLVTEGSPMARAGSVWDVRGDAGIDSSDLFQRIQESAYNLAPTEYSDFVSGAFRKFSEGTSTAQDLVNDLRHVFGNDLGQLPSAARMDVMLETADLGRGVGREIVTFGGPKTWQHLNLYTPEEMVRFPRGGR